MLAGVFRVCLNICTGVLKHTVTSTLTPNNLFLIARGRRWYTPDLRPHQGRSSTMVSIRAIVCGDEVITVVRVGVYCQSLARQVLREGYKQTATTGHRDPDCRECGSCSAVSRRYVLSTHVTIYQQT
jgi:hypothetical protein